MAIGYVTALRTTRMDAVKTAIDAGVGAGKLKIYNGARPATGGAATTLLATLLFTDPCGTVTNGVLNFSALTADTNAAATGTATWARVTDSTDAFVADMSVGVTGSGADVELNSTSIIITGTVQGTAVRSITEGNA